MFGDPAGLGIRLGERPGERTRCYAKLVARRTFSLACGIELGLESLTQSAVYAGLLEGVPTREMNERIIRHLADQAKSRDGHDAFVIEPVQTPIELTKPYPLGTPARIPSIACVGLFVCGTPARDRNKDYSSLTVIWFQEDFAFPLSEQAEHAIRDLDWKGLACDREH